MKILQLLPSKYFSGAEKLVCHIISMSNSIDNLEMVYCCQDGPIRYALVENGINHCFVKKFTISEVKRVIKEQKPDLIHSHDMRAGFIASMSSFKIPIVSHIHNNAFDSRGFSLKSAAYFFAAIRAKYIFWVSESAYKGYIFHKFFKNKSEILNNIVDYSSLVERAKLDSNTYEYDIVYVGRFVYAKNPERLISVFDKILKRIPNCKIGIAGEGQLLVEAKELAKKLNIDDKVDFLGYLENPLKLIRDSRVLIMTSRYEGMPMVALEAMAMGTPIVSTPVDGMMKLVDNGETGFLCDDDEEMVNCICKIIKDKELRNSLSINSVDKLKSICDAEKYMESIVCVYRKCQKN